MTDPDHSDEGRSSRRSPASLASDFVSVSRDNEIRLVAAGVAYYLFNSLVALLLFVFIGLFAIGGFETVVESSRVVAGVDVDRITSALESMIGEGTGRRRAGLLAGVILLWSSFMLIQAINVAFAAIYNVHSERSTVRTLLDSLVVFATVVVAVPLVSLVVVSVTALIDAPGVRILTVPVLFVVFLSAFVPMYYRFPGGETTLRESFPGAAFAAITWTVCAVLFRLYVTTSESIRLYGAVGAVLLVLTWLYVGGLILLVGAVVNAVLAGRVDVDTD